MKNSDWGWHQTECLPVLSDSWSLFARGDLNQISLVIWPVFIATVHQSVRLALQGLPSILSDDERADVGVRWIIVLNQYDRIKLIIPLWQQHAGKPGPLQVYELPSANNILSPKVCVCVCLTQRQKFHMARVWFPQERGMCPVHCSEYLFLTPDPEERNSEHMETPTTMMCGENKKRIP